MNVSGQQTTGALSQERAHTELVERVKSFIANPSQAQLPQLGQDFRNARDCGLKSIDLSGQLGNSEWRVEGRKDRLCNHLSRLLAKELLTANTSLVSLNFSGCYLSRASRALILNVLADGAVNLEHLQMDLQTFPSRQGMNKKETAAAQRVLGQCGKLKTLMLETQPKEVEKCLSNALGRSGTKTSVYLGGRLVEARHSDLGSVSESDETISVDFSHDELLSLINGTSSLSQSSSAATLTEGVASLPQSASDPKFGPLAFIDEEASIEAEYFDKIDPLNSYFEMFPVSEVSVPVQSQAQTLPQIQESMQAEDLAMEVELDALTCYTELQASRL